MKKQVTPQTVFPLCYFPPIPWFVAALRHGQVWLDAGQPYRKQQYSSRAFIQVANRTLPLTIPVERRSARAPLRDKAISFAEDWAGQHWRSLRTAYRNSPYFTYYEDRLAPLFHAPEAQLAAHNRRCLQVVLDLLHLDLDLGDLPGEAPAPAADYRQAFDPSLRTLPPWFDPQPYGQVFEPFVPGLSILDLLCNLGPESSTYLRATWREV